MAEHISQFLFLKHASNYGNILIYLENMVYSPPTALCFVLQIVVRLQNECRGVSLRKIQLTMRFGHTGFIRLMDLTVTWQKLLTSIMHNACVL